MYPRRPLVGFAALAIEPIASLAVIRDVCASAVD
jgi:hypothetical protein